MYNLEQNVPRGTFEKFSQYLELIKAWNRKINLSSRSQNIEDIFEESAKEALIISRYCKGKKSIDVGSGGGFPGMFLGILGCEITLIEINMKKCVFLQNAVSKLGLSNVAVINSDIKKHANNCDFIISKAVTTVSELVEMTSHLINDDTKIFLPKSNDQIKEVDELEKRWSFELQKEEIKDNNKDVILILSKLTPR